EMFDEPDLQKMTVQFLYNEGDELVFMDQATYEQYPLPKEMLGEEVLPWLTDGFQLELLKYNGEIISKELPNHVFSTVASVESGTKGDTASGKVMSKAILDNGVVIQVPTYIKEGT